MDFVHLHLHSTFNAAFQYITLNGFSVFLDLDEQPSLPLCLLFADNQYILICIQMSDNLSLTARCNTNIEVLRRITGIRFCNRRRQRQAQHQCANQCVEVLSKLSHQNRLSFTQIHPNGIYHS